nr:hypothetical protein [Tanacetum cinerariifolium]
MKSLKKVQPQATRKTKKNLLKQQYGNFKAERKETLEQTFNRPQAIVSQLEFIDVEIEQDDLNQKLLTSLAPRWLMHTVVWRNRIDLDAMSLDDLYNHLKVYEPKVHKKSDSQNMAFISSSKNNSGNKEDNIASVPTASTQVSLAGLTVPPASISLNTAWKKISIQGIDVAGFDKSKVECFNCHKIGHLATECRAPRSQDRGRRDNFRQGSKVEEQAPKALMAIDRVGWDWSYMANDEENHALVTNEEAPTEFALMAKTSTDNKVFDNSLCSKACLSQVKGRLVEFKNQEIKFCEKIRGLKFSVECKTNRIKNLANELETLKKEKEGLESKLTGFKSASKDLDNILKSQRTPEFADDTITDYTRPSPSVENNSTVVKTNKKETVGSLLLNMLNYIEKLQRGLMLGDSGCSRHMTGNISYLSYYEPYDEGYVSFGQGGCKITSKGTIKTCKVEFKNVYFVKDLKYNLFSVSQICDNKNSVLFTDSECIVLGRNFKLSDDANVLLRTPRQHNMYSIDLNNVVPHKDLTCLVAKAFADECMLWHRRLGHLNIKTMYRLVRHNLVRGLPSKCFENYHTCVVCLKGKQHKASCKTKLVNSVTKPLYTLHMDLFGPTSVSSLNHKWYCLVVTDDFSRFTWTFFIKTKDETSGILRNFIIEIENLKELRVNIIRCDNGGEFRNKDMNDFCSRKGIKREFSNARTPQHNGVAERRNRTLIEAARTMVLVNKSQNKTPYELFNCRTPAIGFLKSFGFHVIILNTLDNLGKFDAKGDEGTKVAASQDVSSLRYIALPNLFHKAHLESSTSSAQDACNADAPKGSGNSNPTATSKISPAKQMETLIVETAIPTVSSPVLTACLDDSLEPSSNTRLISKRVTSQDDTPSLDNSLNLSNRFEDILGVTTNIVDSNEVEADLDNMKNNISESYITVSEYAQDMDVDLGGS